MDGPANRSISQRFAATGSRCRRSATCSSAGRAHGPAPTPSSSPRRARPATSCSASSLDAARSLLGLGIEPGDTVAMLMPNCLDFLHVLFGCALVGVRPCSSTPATRSYELAYVLENADAVAIVTTDLISEYVDFVPLLIERGDRRPAAAPSPPDHARRVLARRLPRPRRLPRARRRRRRSRSVERAGTRCASVTSRS